MSGGEVSPPRVDGIEKDYEVQEFLGQGGFAMVYKGTRRRDNLPVALKYCDKTKQRESAMELLRKEYDLLRGFSHPNILKTHGFLESSDGIVVVLEYCRGGDLAKFVRERGSPSGPDASYLLDVRMIVTGILKGLNFIHSKCDAIHRDLKPRSIFVTRKHFVGKRFQ